MNRFSEVLRELPKNRNIERIDVTSAFKAIQLATPSLKIKIFYQTYDLLAASSSTHKIKIKTTKKDLPELDLLVCVRRFDLALDRHLKYLTTKHANLGWQSKNFDVQFGQHCPDTKTLEVVVKFEDLTAGQSI